MCLVMTKGGICDTVAIMNLPTQIFGFGLSLEYKNYLVVILSVIITFIFRYSH